jgi:hypothetical protein
MKGVRPAAALLIAIVVPTRVVGQTCLATANSVSCSIPGQVVLTANGVVSLQASSVATTLPPPSPADYDAGFNSTVGQTLTIAANQAWTVYIRAAAPVWTATTTSQSTAARATKPVGDLGWSTASNGVFTPLSTTDVKVVSGPATGENIATLYFRTAYNWRLDTPGIYSLSLMVTLTAP